MEYLFDTHFHLDLQKERILALREIESRKIYTIAVTNLPDLYRKEIVEVSSKFIRIALGFHPELVHEYKRQVPLMWELLPSARYIGEVGLDFSDKSFQNEQLCFFKELIERCRYDSGKIISIHSRKAVKDVLDILGDNYRFKAILHWFTGNKKELYEAIERGCFFSVNSAMIQSKRFIDLLPIIPSERLLLETDSPFVLAEVSQYESLRKIESEIRKYKPDIEMWTNFKRLIGK